MVDKLKGDAIDASGNLVVASVTAGNTQMHTTGITISNVSINTTSIAVGNSSSNIALVHDTIRGPATMYIDPSAVGDNTGLLIVKGDLQVDGTTTTINSTTVTVDDKNIVLASGAVNNAAADGAGITIDTVNANITYNSTSNTFDITRGLNVTGAVFANGAFTVANSTANVVKVSTSGVVGIGTDSANNSMLHIVGNWVSGQSTVKVQGKTSNLTGVGLYSTDGVRQAYLFHTTGYNSLSSNNIPLAITTDDGVTNAVTISTTGTVLINTANSTAGGFNNKLIVKQTDNQWTGGIGVEAASNDHVLTIASNTTHHVIAGSYRSLSGYRPLVIQNGGNPGITMDSSGRVIKPYTPAFSAYYPQITGQSNTIVWTGTRHNQGSHFNTSTGRFTAPIAGFYFFTFNALMNANADYARLYFNYNGTHNATLGETLIGGSYNSGNGWSNGFSYVTLSASLGIYMNANEYMGVWNDSPISTYGADYGSFSGFLVG